MILDVFLRAPRDVGSRPVAEAHFLMAPLRLSRHQAEKPAQQMREILGRDAAVAQQACHFAVQRRPPGRGHCKDAGQPSIHAHPGEKRLSARHDNGLRDDERIASGLLRGHEISLRVRVEHEHLAAPKLPAVDQHEIRWGMTAMATYPLEGDR